MPSVDNAIARPLWLDRLDPAITPRPPLPGDVEVDVAVVGGGFSGLWTAYYLHRLDPSLRIAVLEKTHCGFGASGRNGGWAVGELAGSFEAYAARGGDAAALQLHREVFDSVDEIGRVLHAEDIDGDYAKGGTIYVARSAPQEQRGRADVAESHAHGLTEDDIRWVDAEEASTHLGATKVRGGVHFAHTASVDPAKIARGLADVLERGGVSVFEQTAVLGIEPTSGDAAGARVRTEHGTVSADVVVRATEAYTRDLEGERRTIAPIYSFMIATEPLDAGAFQDIGLHQRQTFADMRYMVTYGQRTADDRLAFGCAGVPYLFGSKISAEHENHLPTHRNIHEILVDMLPQVADAEITHRWGGVLGIPRQWVPGLTFDRASGVATLGGYIGEGVAAANLAGRTLAELIVGEETVRTGLPWVGVTNRKWEPEPLRFIGVRASRGILTKADDLEFRKDEEAKFATWLSRLLRGA